MTSLAVKALLRGVPVLTKPSFSLASVAASEGSQTAAGLSTRAVGIQGRMGALICRLKLNRSLLSCLPALPALYKRKLPEAYSTRA